MAKILSKELLKSIDTHLLNARNKRVILDVYRTAEVVQLENPTANVALEEIIEYIIINGGSNFVAEFSPWTTRKIPMAINDSQPEFMMVTDEALSS